MKKSVLIIANNYLPFDPVSPRGGLERVVNEHVDALKSDYEVTVYCSADSIPQGSNLEFKYLHWTHECRNYSSLDRYPNSDIIKQLKEHLSKVSYNIIINHFVNSGMVQMLVNNTNSQIFNMFHAAIDSPFSKSNYQNMLIGSSRLTSVCVSKFIYKHLRSVFPEYLGKISILPNTFPEPNTSEFTESPEDYYIMLGRISPHRRFDVANEVSMRLKLPIKICGMLGSDKYHRDWWEGSGKYQLSSSYMEWLGHVPQKEAFQILCKAKGLLILTPFEAFNLGAFEAQKLGVPIIYNYKHTPENNGISDYAVENLSAASFNSLRFRTGKMVSHTIEAIERANSFSRNEIFKYFNNTYSSTKYKDKLISLIEGES